MLTFHANNTDHLAVVIAECRRMEIPVLPPDIHASAMESAIAKREKKGPCRTLEDFCSRSKKAIRATAGATTSLKEKPFVRPGAAGFIGHIPSVFLR